MHLFFSALQIFNEDIYLFKHFYIYIFAPNTNITKRCEDNSNKLKFRV